MGYDACRSWGTNMTVTVSYIRPFSDNNLGADRRYQIIAYGDVELPEVGLKLIGVKLVRHPDGTHAAHTPAARCANGCWAIQWSKGSPIERAVRKALVEAFTDILTAKEAA